MTDKLKGVRPHSDADLLQEEHAIVKLRLRDDFAAFLRAPTDEILRALAGSAMNYQSSLLLERERERKKNDD